MIKKKILDFSFLSYYVENVLLLLIFNIQLWNNLDPTRRSFGGTVHEWQVSSGMDIRAWSSEGCVTPSNEVILRSDESSLICDCDEGSGGIKPVRGHMEY